MVDTFPVFRHLSRKKVIPNPENNGSNTIEKGIVRQSMRQARLHSLGRREQRSGNRQFLL